MTAAVDARIVERYRRLRALAASPHAHEAAVACGLAEELEQTHGLAAVSLRAHAPGGAVVVRDLPWWGVVVLCMIAEHLRAEGGIAAPTWEYRDGDAWIIVTGSRLAVDRARLLWAGVRAVIAIEIGAMRPGCELDIEETDALALAAAGAFARNLAELRAFRREGAAIVVWREPEAAPERGIAPWQLRRLYAFNYAAAQRGDRLGSVLGSRLEMNRPRSSARGRGRETELHLAS